MPTVTTGFRREFASPALASRYGRPTVCARRWRAAGLLVLGVACAITLGACSTLGLGGKSADAGRAQSRQDAPKPDAFAEVRAQIVSSPREPYWPYHLAELYLSADSTSAAIEQLKASLAVDPDYAPAVSLLSRIYYDARMHPQAVTLLESYLARHAQADDALRAALALNYEALGEADNADAALARCAAGSREASCARVLAMLRHNDKNAMVAEAKRALDQDKNSAANHNNYGIALLMVGRPFDARDEFRAALDIDGALPGALYNMAIVETFYFFDDASGRDWYARYLRVDTEDPDNLKAHFNAVVSTTGPAPHEGTP